MCTMEPFFSFAPHRRREWQGHETKANVRNTIRCARRDGRDLRVFASQHIAGCPGFVEVPPSAWDEYFAEGSAVKLFDLIIDRWAGEGEANA